MANLLTLSREPSPRRRLSVARLHNLAREDRNMRLQIRRTWAWVAKARAANGQRLIPVRYRMS